MIRFWALLLLVELALSTLRFSTIVRLLEKLGQRSAGRILRPAEVHQKRRLLEIAARHHLFSMTCLRQAIVLFLTLKCAGFPCSLKIGVAKDTLGIKAHAWVDYKGMCDSHSRYREVLSI